MNLHNAPEKMHDFIAAVRIDYPNLSPFMITKDYYVTRILNNLSKSEELIPLIEKWCFLVTIYRPNFYVN